MKALRVFAVFMAMTNLLIYVAWLRKTRDGLDPATLKPIAGDFTSFWVAARAVLAGHPTLSYDLTAQTQGVLHAAAYPPGSVVGILPFSYPPTYLMLMAPFGLLPVNLAFTVWMVATNAFFILVLHAILPKTPFSFLVPLALGFSGFLINLSYGQNGALTAAVLGLALVNLRIRPILAGFCLAFLACKPQIGILVPFALLAGRQYRVFGIAAGGTILLALTSAAILGPATWLAFFHFTGWSQHALLSQGAMVWPKICSLFASLRLLGVPPAVAYLAQGAAASAAIFAVWRIWRAAPATPRANVALIAGIMLVSPYLLNYDLMFLGLAIAFLARDAAAHGMPPHLRPVFAMLWFAPALSGIASAHAVPFAPALGAALLIYLGSAPLQDRLPGIAMLGQVP